MKKFIAGLLLCGIIFSNSIVYANVNTTTTYPTAGVSTVLTELRIDAIKHPILEEEPVEIVAEAETEEIETKVNTDCWKKYTAKQFRKLGRVRYGSYTYTYYSEKVLPGGGLKIPDRHLICIDGLYFVADIDGYIVVASDNLSKGSIVETPVGTMGKVYDCGSGRGNIDLYVSW